MPIDKKDPFPSKLVRCNSKLAHKLTLSRHTKTAYNNTTNHPKFGILHPPPPPLMPLLPLPSTMATPTKKCLWKMR
jgi:hypothetical protein